MKEFTKFVVSIELKISLRLFSLRSDFTVFPSLHKMSSCEAHTSLVPSPVTQAHRGARSPIVVSHAAFPKSKMNLPPMKRIFHVEVSLKMYIVSAIGTRSTRMPALTSGRSVSPASFVGSASFHVEGILPGDAAELHFTVCGSEVPLLEMPIATR